MTLYLLNFNSYYNRIYKPLTLDTMEYDDIVHIAYDVNFNPNDGVNTSITLNVPSGAVDRVDYLLTLDDVSREETRWFVIEASRTRLNQYQITLRRDLLSDFYSYIVNAPMFIEKATIRYGNPLLFNSEDMTFNQIKSSETSLTDKTQCPWIVGYINKDIESKTITVPFPDTRTYVAEYATIQDIPFYANRDRFLATSNDITSYLYYDTLKVEWFQGIVNRIGIKQDGSSSTYSFKASDIDDYKGLFGRDGWTPEKLQNEAATYYNANRASFENLINTAVGLQSQSNTAAFLSTYSAEGSIFKIGDKYYKISRKELGSGTELYNPPKESDLFNAFLTMANSMPTLYVQEHNVKPTNFRVSCSYVSYSLSIEEVAAASEYKLTIPAPSSRIHLVDAPYDMFAIPYNYNTTFSVIKTGDEVISNTSAEASMSIAQKMVEELTGQQIYDLQLLPYCPLPGIVGNKQIHFTEQYKENANYSYITRVKESVATNVSVLLWLDSSSFSFNIEHTIEVDYEDAKVQALCDFHRLVSPNYNGQFEFNAVKNEGVDYFSVDATYKPYNPYIHVAPNFKGLYGNDYNDARGLICGGDFSLPTITDRWAEYELNNKNYLNTFNRQIENMEVNNKYQRQAEIWQAISGTVSGGVSGLTIGAVASGGNPYAIAGGTVAGLGIAGAGGIMDVNINDKLRSEALDYTKDQFGYSLGNIRALPYSLNRVSAFNINNKIFPILEYYTCSDTEKEALRNKMLYNGMTVMTIGTLNEYIMMNTQYLKGKLIRLEGLDNHTIIEIANELNQGFYIGGN